LLVAGNSACGGDDVDEEVATDVGSVALNLGKCGTIIINRDVPWKATALEQSGKRVHRIDGTAAKYEVTTLVRIATLENVRLAMVERRAGQRDLLLGASGERTHATGNGGRNFFEPALEFWSKDRW
jgi:hypothetical protein